MGLLLHNEGKAWDMYRNGDDNMFGTIYSAYSGVLYKYGLKFTPNSSIVEDAIQDIFLELYKNRKTVGPTDNILRYVLTSFRRKLFRLLNHEKRYDLKKGDEEYSFEIRYSIEHDMIIDETAEIRTASYRKALENLSPRQKEVIYLKYTTGLDYEEVAAIMDMNVESCRNLLCRAIKALKHVLLDQGKIKLKS
jgi:RNA polymerase sigma factor (sigma-70 family)